MKPYSLGFRWIAFVPVMLLVASAAFARGEVEYSVTDLGNLGLEPTFPFAINDNADVAGYSYPSSGVQHAFLYRAGSMLDLGTLGGPSSYGTGLNQSGQVVGYSYLSSGFLSYHAFLYSDGSMADAAASAGWSVAQAINNSGVVVGRATTNGPYADYHACIFQAGAAIDLGTLGGQRSQAWGINDAGQVVGWSFTPEVHTHAFLYSNGTMTDFGTLGGTNSNALRINNLGQVVGSADKPDGSKRGFLYVAGTMSDLGTLPGASTSQADGINDRGDIVGSSGGRACLWRNGLAFDLNTLIVSNSGWFLDGALAINNWGQIVGTGTNTLGRGRAFLLTPFRNLYVNRTAGRIALTWFTNAPVKFSLYESPALSPANWTAVTNEPLVTNAQYSVDLPADAPGGRFYRLQVQ